MVLEMYSMKDAAKELGVEPHALRYWEEELKLHINRSEKGRRVYSQEDIQKFKRVMECKKQGMQLKEIRQLLHEGEKEQVETSNNDASTRRIIMYRPKENLLVPELEENDKSEKAKRLQELLKQFISESVKESNAELLPMLKEGLLKELDYQFRLQEEREEEREKLRIEKEDEHFRQLDENIRIIMEKRGKKKRRR